jgi:hypothetical protein
MAVLGFIGICGVLRTTGSSPAPRAVEWVAAALAVAALVVACLAVFTVGQVAYPVTATAVTSTAGQAWCGQLVDGLAGAISVRTASGVVAVPARAIAQVRPVAACP